MAEAKSTTVISRRRMLQAAVALTAGGRTVFSSFAARAADAGNRARGLALTIGLGAVSSARYGSPNALRGPRNDALDMAKLAESIPLSGTQDRAFWDVRCLLDNASGNKQATVENVRKHILDASARLKSGDFFLVYYSGHGSYKANLNAQSDPEASGTDQTWCLFDDQWVDDDRGLLWTAFQPDVRILLINDCCHSGSSAKTLIDLAGIPMIEQELTEHKSLHKGISQTKTLLESHGELQDLRTRLSKLAEATYKTVDAASKAKPKALPKGGTVKDLGIMPTIGLKQLPEPLAGMLAAQAPLTLNMDHPQLKYVKSTVKGDRVAEETAAFVLSLSACSDYTTALDAAAGNRNSVFTDILKTIFSTKKFSNYDEFFRAVEQASLGYPTPVRYSFGKGKNFGSDAPFFVS